MEQFLFDGRWMQRTDEGYAYIYEILGICEKAGRNLDALYDLLTERGKMTQIQIDHSDEMDPGMKKVILNAAVENKYLKIVLTK